MKKLTTANDSNLAVKDSRMMKKKQQRGCSTGAMDSIRYESGTAQLDEGTRAAGP